MIADRMMKMIVGINPYPVASAAVKVVIVFAYLSLSPTR